LRRDPPPAEPLRRPQSATHFAVGLLGLIVGLALVWAMAPWRHSRLAGLVAYAPLIPCLGIVLTIAGIEWWFPQLRGPSPEALARGPLRPLAMKRVGVRLCGLTAALALVAAAYWLFPEYRGDFYEPYWRFLRSVAPAAVLIPLYFCWADRRAGEGVDEYQAMGMLVLGRFRSVEWRKIRRLLAGWTVKAFFLPLMVVYLGNELKSLYGALEGASPDTMPVYQVFYHLSYAVDLLFCVVGYSATTRLFDAQIRSVEPTVAG
jgi:hypothetical protein